MLRVGILAVLSFQAAACELPALPKAVYIEGRFSDLEASVVESAIDQVNASLVEPCLGYDGLEYRGILDDEDGFSPYAFADDFHVIYTLDEESEEYSWLSCTTGRGFGGYATLQDVLMIANLDEIRGLDARIEGIESDPDLAMDEALQTELDGLLERRTSLIDFFRHVILHELGHHIGLTHNPDDDALMNADSRDDTLDFQEADRDAFAYVRGCRYSE